MKWNLNSALNERKDVVRIGRMAETWCRNHMGLNNKKQLQIIVSYWKSFDGDTDMGEYDPQDHAIYIYYNNIDNVKELLQTIIHEWAHSLQPLTSKWKEYNDVAYSRNPFEREAYKAEALYSELWKSIKHKLNR
jgi:hypothetical protein